MKRWKVLLHQQNGIRALILLKDLLITALHFSSFQDFKHSWKRLFLFLTFLTFPCLGLPPGYESCIIHIIDPSLTSSFNINYKYICISKVWESRCPLTSYLRFSRLTMTTSSHSFRRTGTFWANYVFFFKPDKNNSLLRNEDQQRRSELPQHLAVNPRVKESFSLPCPRSELVKNKVTTKIMFFSVIAALLKSQASWDTSSNILSP